MVVVVVGWDEEGRGICEQVVVVEFGEGAHTDVLVLGL